MGLVLGLTSEVLTNELEPSIDSIKDNTWS